MNIRRWGRVEFFAGETDSIYGPFNFGIQLSLTCVAIMFGKWSAGVMYIFRDSDYEKET